MTDMLDLMQKQYDEMKVRAKKFVEERARDQAKRAAEQKEKNRRLAYQYVQDAIHDQNTRAHIAKQIEDVVPQVELAFIEDRDRCMLIHQYTRIYAIYRPDRGGCNLIWKPE